MRVHIVVYSCSIDEEWEIAGVFTDMEEAEEFAHSKKSAATNPFHRYHVESWEVST